MIRIPPSDLVGDVQSKFHKRDSHLKKESLTVWPQLSTLKALQWRGNPTRLVQRHTFFFQYFENMWCSDRNSQGVAWNVSKLQVPRIPQYANISEFSGTKIMKTSQTIHTTNNALDVLCTKSPYPTKQNKKKTHIA